LCIKLNANFSSAWLLVGVRCIQEHLGNGRNSSDVFSPVSGSLDPVAWAMPVTYDNHYASS
jgi:hypothetical protein